VTRRLIIDTDTASDDAVALLMALREPSIEVEAITVVAGNVTLDQAVQNALYTAEIAGRPEVPIHAGRAAPLMRPLETAELVHGKDGMGDIGLPLSGREPAGDRAIDVLTDTITGSAGEITLVTLGPLTNVAVALLAEPRIADAIDHCFIMGGTGTGGGNTTPLAEFNLWADPEAARVVVRSGMPLTLVGWDISVASATFGPDEAEALRSIGPLGGFAVDIQAVLDDYAREYSDIAGFDLPDPITMAVAIDPSIATFERHHVDVLIGDGPERGQDVVDWLGLTGLEPNARITRHVPRQAFTDILERALAG
jgi:purine nucleosidase